MRLREQLQILQEYGTKINEFAEKDQPRERLETALRTIATIPTFRGEAIRLLEREDYPVNKSLAPSTAFSSSLGSLRSKAGMTINILSALLEEKEQGISVLMPQVSSLTQLGNACIDMDQFLHRLCEGQELQLAGVDRGSIWFDLILNPEELKQFILLIKTSAEALRALSDVLTSLINALEADPNLFEAIQSLVEATLTTFAKRLLGSKESKNGRKIQGKIKLFKEIWLFYRREGRFTTFGLTSSTEEEPQKLPTAQSIKEDVEKVQKLLDAANHPFLLMSVEEGEPTRQLEAGDTSAAGEAQEAEIQEIREDPEDT